MMKIDFSKKTDWYDAYIYFNYDEYPNYADCCGRGKNEREAIENLIHKLQNQQSEIKCAIEYAKDIQKEVNSMLTVGKFYKDMNAIGQRRIIHILHIVDSALCGKMYVAEASDVGIINFDVNSVSEQDYREVTEKEWEEVIRTR